MPRDESDCGCFAEGHGLHADNNSYSYNDFQGDCLVAQLVILVLLLAALCVALGMRAWKTSGGIGAVFGALLIYTVVTVTRRPILMLYTVSAHMTRHVRTPAVLDPRTQFPPSWEFESAFDDIRKEVLHLVATHNAPLTRDTFDGENEYIGSDVKADGVGWRFLGLKYGPVIMPMAREHTPTLAAILDKHTDLILSCGVSILPPGVCIPEHVGYYKGFLRYMLAIEVPEPAEDVYLCVNGQKVTWSEGESVLFDDTFSHKVYNKTEGRRIVLYMDIRRDLGSDMDMTQRISDWMLQQVSTSDQVRDEIRRTEQIQAIE